MKPRTSDPNSCHQVTLAQAGVAQVQSCTECGCVSIHLGATTLRFEPEGLEALWRVVGEAVAVLRQRRELGMTSPLGTRGVA